MPGYRSQPLACHGATPLLYPDQDESFHPPPPFCLTCPHSLPCLRDGWDEDFGFWGSFHTEDRYQARMNNLSPEDLWATRFPSNI